MEFSLCPVNESLLQEIKIIGERIFLLRQRLGISRKDLAEACNVSQNTIAKIENGITPPSFPTMFSIARFFGVRYETFDPQKKFKVPSFSVLKEKTAEYFLSNNPASLKDYSKKLSSNKALSILRERIIPTAFLATPREVKEIRLYFKEEFDAKTDGSTISNALRKLIEDGLIKKVPSSKKRVFLYVKIRASKKK